MPSMTKKNFSSDLYLNLIKLVLTNYIYGEYEAGAALAQQKAGSEIIATLLKRWNLQLTYVKPFDKKKRSQGQDWPLFSHTMIGIAGLNNLQFCLRDILKNEVPGDVIEAGVWRGGASIFESGS